MVSEEIVDYVWNINHNKFQKDKYDKISKKLHELVEEATSEDSKISKEELLQICFDAIEFYSSTLLYLKDKEEEKFVEVLEEFQLLFG